MKNYLPNKQSNNTPMDLDKTIENIDPSLDTKEEYGGPKYPEPTRYGDWERKGRVSDF